MNLCEKVIPSLFQNTTVDYLAGNKLKIVRLPLIKDSSDEITIKFVKQFCFQIQQLKNNCCDEHHHVHLVIVT